MSQRRVRRFQGYQLKHRGDRGYWKRGAQLHDPINSILSRWRLTVYMDAVIVFIAESGGKESNP